MKYKKKETGEIFGGSHIIEKWPDGSDKTVEELYKLYPNKEYELCSNPNASRQAEIFELACRLLVGFAQAGVKPSPSDCIEIAKESYHLKDTKL